MTHPKYPHVFSPIRLGPVELKNRFYSSPHAVPLNWLGAPTADYLAYVEARAKGGCGLVMLRMAAFHRPTAVSRCPQLKENIPAFRALADAVRAAGGKIFGEPWYFWSGPGSWQPYS